MQCRPATTVSEIAKKQCSRRSADKEVKNSDRPPCTLRVEIGSSVSAAQQTRFAEGSSERHHFARFVCRRD